jgi:hypothetical protein
MGVAIGMDIDDQILGIGRSLRSPVREGLRHKFYSLESGKRDLTFMINGIN